MSCQHCHSVTKKRKSSHLHHLVVGDPPNEPDVRPRLRLDLGGRRRRQRDGQDDQTNGDIKWFEIVTIHLQRRRRRRCRQKFLWSRRRSSLQWDDFGNLRLLLKLSDQKGGRALGKSGKLRRLPSFESVGKIRHQLYQIYFIKKSFDWALLFWALRSLSAWDQLVSKLLSTNGSGLSRSYPKPVDMFSASLNLTCAQSPQWPLKAMQTLICLISRGLKIKVHLK